MVFSNVCMLVFAVLALTNIIVFDIPRLAACMNSIVMFVYACVNLDISSCRYSLNISFKMHGFNPRELISEKYDFDRFTYSPLAVCTWVC